ncbi:hypothetical protein RIF29_16956 [Crotalaria pallida]|uniref:Transmembrane protein n=1 Tax=Crotalaria pallida TaxID=3830 RepID=A0AAN9IK66_CROPI
MTCTTAAPSERRPRSLSLSFHNNNNDIQNPNGEEREKKRKENGRRENLRERNKEPNNPIILSVSLFTLLPSSPHFLSFFLFFIFCFRALSGIYIFFVCIYII